MGPIGSYDYHFITGAPKERDDFLKFVRPFDLINISKKNNLSLKKLDGMKFNILDNSWKISNDTSVNYIVKFKKI